jgi:predicted DCC family thiol-disulfide oxidoreductase YuxK
LTTTPDSRSDPAIVLFDGVCNLCQGTVGFLLPRDRRGRLRFASLQSDTGRRLLAEHGLDRAAPDSVVLVEDGRAWVKSSAALRIARHLGGAWRLFALFRVVPRPLRDWAYDVIARNRLRFLFRSEG